MNGCKMARQRPFSGEGFGTNGANEHTSAFGWMFFFVVTQNALVFMFHPNSTDRAMMCF